MTVPSRHLLSNAAYTSKNAAPGGNPNRKRRSNCDLAGYLGIIVTGVRQPFGNDFGTYVYFAAMGNSVYNSLQLSLKHSDGGLTILASYTYGKSLDQASSPGWSGVKLRRLRESCVDGSPDAAAALATLIISSSSFSSWDRR